MSCPLEICIHDLPQGRQQLEHEQRQQKALDLRALGSNNQQIADALGVTTRTVTRLTN